MSCEKAGHVGHMDIYHCSFFQWKRGVKVVKTKKDEVIRGNNREKRVQCVQCVQICEFGLLIKVAKRGCILTHLNSYCKRLHKNQKGRYKCKWFAGKRLRKQRT